MPFSYSSQLSTIVGYAEQRQPRSVLDVGVGMGQYGFLLRTNLEHVHLFDVQGPTARQRPKSEWRVTIDGIEGFAGYLTPVHEYAYNRVLIGDALAILPTLPADAYDLVLAIDVLEHFASADAARFITELKRVAAGAVLISTPKAVIAQEVEANPFENHRSHWTPEALAGHGFEPLLEHPECLIMTWRPSAPTAA
jgi:predicted TPR repeat methyltransferase